MPLSPTDLKLLAAHVSTHGSADGFVPKYPKKKRKNLESEMQRDLIKWWSVFSVMHGIPEILLFSIPNGGGGGKMRGHWLKLEGLRAGLPDLMLCLPKTEIVNCNEEVTHAHALFLELKTTTGKLSPEQEIYHGVLRASGYKVEVCRTLEDAQGEITRYLTA